LLELKYDLSKLKSHLFFSQKFKNLSFHNIRKTNIRNLKKNKSKFSEDKCQQPFQTKCRRCLGSLCTGISIGLPTISAILAADLGFLFFF